MIVKSLSQVFLHFLANLILFNMSIAVAEWWRISAN